MVKCHGDKMTCNRFSPKVKSLKNKFLNIEVLYHAKGWIRDNGWKPARNIQGLQCNI